MYAEKDRPDTRHDFLGFDDQRLVKCLIFNTSDTINVMHIIQRHESITKTVRTSRSTDEAIEKRMRKSNLALVPY